MNKMIKSVEEAISSQNILAKEILNNNLKPALLDKYKALGEELAIIKSDFMCESCESQENLTIHHLIKRDNKQVLPIQRYLTQRRYYKNICVLCIKCHGKVDEGRKNPIINGNSNILKKDKFDKIKKMYQLEDVK